MNLYRGIVEDHNDPMKQGRVRVRVFGLHTQTNDDSFESVKTTDLPWSEVMGGTDFGLRGGTGFSSVLREGTWVWCILEQDNPNKILVVGTVKGDTSLSTDTQPAEETYTNSAALHTEGGHVLELNDTDGHKTIRLAHTTGTMVTMDNDGNLKVYAQNDQNIIVDGNSNVQIVGNSNVVMGGNSTIVVKGDSSIVTEGNASIASNNNINIQADGNIDMGASGNINIQADGTIDIGATGAVSAYGSTVNLNDPGDSHSTIAPKIESDVVIKPTSLEAALVDSATSEETNIESVTAPDGYPQHPEQNSSSIGGMPSAGGEKEPEESVPMVNPYDKANEALKLGNSAWSENHSTGSGANANIKKLWEELGYNGGTFADTTAWCAVFTNAMLKRSGNNYIQTASSQAMREYGSEVAIEDIQQGDIIVFYRGGINSGKGHVGFATGRTKTVKGVKYLEMLGGNQGDTLCVRWFATKKGTSWGLRTIRRGSWGSATVEAQNATSTGGAVV